jgi:hypothetical protein
MRRPYSIIIAACVLWVSATAARAAEIAVFDNPAYVDTTSGGLGAEADNVRATLALLGHGVSTFTAIDAAGIASALAGADLVLFPELEVSTGDLAADLTTQAIATLADFVADGHGLIIHGTTDQKATELLNVLFGYAMSSGSVGPADLTADAIGTAFESGVAVLPDNVRTRGVDNLTLPDDAKVFYLNFQRAVVARTAHRSGRVLYLGWDWFDAIPIGGEDGGWIAVLDAAVDDVLACRGAGPDSDGDGIIDDCDAPDVCADVDGMREFEVGSRLRFRRIGAGGSPDDDRLRLTGELELPAGTAFDDLDPMTTPIVFVVRDVDGNDLVAQSFPLTAYDGKGSVGWRLSRGGNKWTFRDTADVTNGLGRATLKERSGQTVRIDIKGRSGSYPVNPGDEPVTVLAILGDPEAGECAQTAFPDIACRFNNRFTALSCRR